MREIKFRAWDLEKGLMTAEHFSINKSGRVHNCVCYIQEFALMQYTGLKDKNGKEIYEGDIVKYGDMDYETKQIEFNNDVWEEGYYHYSGFAFPEGSDQLEVIGNIYENQDLINQVK